MNHVTCYDMTGRTLVDCDFEDLRDAYIYAQGKSLCTYFKVTNSKGETREWEFNNRVECWVEVKHLRAKSVAEYHLMPLSSQVPVIYAILTQPNAPEFIEVPTVWFDHHHAEGETNQSMLGSVVFCLENFNDPYHHTNGIEFVQSIVSHHHLMIET
jgi:hypothetical protein